MFLRLRMSYVVAYELLRIFMRNKYVSVIFCKIYYKHVKESERVLLQRFDKKSLEDV